ncbi:MAG: nucleotidyl transferase AbiEii/AbiGii toxin family protein [Pseudomonadota bacterium]
MYTSLQLVEIFHLEFLRWFARKLKPEKYALKGGVNLRFFFKSFRYSEDMDLDVSGIEVGDLKELVINIFNNSSFKNTLISFGIKEVLPPDLAKAKQTETTQRFKTHLLTSAGEDLFTKIEFSRRGMKGNIITEPISDLILRGYKLPPLLVSHYDNQSAVLQKIDALATRSVTQARDIFDLFLLSSQFDQKSFDKAKINHTKIEQAYNKIFELSFNVFKNTVLSYLSWEDQNTYNLPAVWDEIKLKVAAFIEELQKHE